MVLKLRFFSFLSRAEFITSVDESKVVSYVIFSGRYTLPLGWSLGASYSGTDFLSCQISQHDRRMRAQADCWTTRATYSCKYNSKADTTIWHRINLVLLSLILFTKSRLRTQWNGDRISQIIQFSSLPHSFFIYRILTTVLNYGNHEWITGLNVIVSLPAQVSFLSWLFLPIGINTSSSACLQWFIFFSFTILHPMYVLLLKFHKNMKQEWLLAF